MNALEKLSWIEQFDTVSDGIVMNRFSHGLGSVLCVRATATERFLTIKKASRRDYEFNRMLAFPGGMVRSPESTFDLEHLLRNSLADRVFSETGFSLDQARLEIPDWYAHPLATSYHAKDRLCVTIVVPLQLTLVEELPVSSGNERSVQDCGWLTLSPEQLDQFAPLNRIVAARLMWPQLNSDERNATRKLVESACHKSDELMADYDKPLGSTLARLFPDDFASNHQS